MRKISAVMIALAPYLLAVSVYLAIETDRFAWVGAGLAVYFCLLITGVILTILCRKSDADTQALLLTGAILKLIHIPFHVVVFLVSFITFPFVILILPVILVIEYALLLSSSLPGILALLLRRKENGKPSLIVHLVFHFVFCLDVVSAIILLFTAKENK